MAQESSGSIPLGPSSKCYRRGVREMKGYLVMLEGPKFLYLKDADRYKVFLHREYAFLHAKNNGYELGFMSISENIGAIVRYGDEKGLITIVPLEIEDIDTKNSLIEKPLTNPLSISSTEVQEYRITSGTDLFTSVNALKKIKLLEYVRNMTTLEEVKVVLEEIVTSDSIKFKS